MANHYAYRVISHCNTTLSKYSQTACKETRNIIQVIQIYLIWLICLKAFKTFKFNGKNYALQKGHHYSTVSKFIYSEFSLYF